MTQTIGQQLKSKREGERLTLEKVFEATRIRIQYLQALETDDLSVLPSSVQARGYLRNYAEFLGLDFEQMLEEMHNISAQHATPQIIGPADSLSSIPQQDGESRATQLVVPSIESLDGIQAQPEPISMEGPEYGLDSHDITASSITVPIKRKPVRRKKEDDSVDRSKSAIVDSPTKRRGRKKADPEAVPFVDVQPEDVEESVSPVETDRQYESIEEPVAVVESVSEFEPIAQELVENPKEELHQTNVSDTLWQTWLNRLSSVLSARMKRRTLIPKDSHAIENESIVISAEPEINFEEEVPDLPQENSLEILKNIGKDLRERRELLSLHFDEVERNTHVKAHYLEALERGALDDLPSTVQTRGMLSNYATFLDLDVDALLLRFADALQARHRERNPQKPARKPGQPIIANMPPVRSFIAGDMIFGVSMAVLLVGFAIWGVSRVMAIQSQREIEPTARSISDVLLASPDQSLFTVTPTFLPVESFPGEATVTVEIPTQSANADVQLNLIAVERTYMQVVVDGKVAFDGRVVPGNAYPFEAQNQIEVLVGSGAAIRTVYNGRDLGLMGTFGQVVNNIYLGTEIITPTSLPTATATITLTPTKTAAPTSTLRFTSTPALSATPVP